MQLFVIYKSLQRDKNKYDRNAKLAIHENNGLTIGEQKNAIQTFITHC